MACKFVIVFWGTGQHYLPPPLQDHPQTKGFCKNVVLQFGRSSYILLPAETRLTVYRRRPSGRSRYILLHARPVLLRSSSDFRLPDRTAETVKQRQNIDQQECALGGLPPTNMPIAKTLYFAIPGTKRKMQECAPGETGGCSHRLCKNALCKLL